jgi:hypothetical protein
VTASDESRGPSSAGTKNANPVAVISMPLRLSGRRRQAISPHAANEPPTRLSTTAGPVTGAPRSVTIGSSAASSAAIVTVHSAAQKPASWRGAAKRPSSPVRASTSRDRVYSCPRSDVKRLRRSALATTDRLEQTIARLATTGLSRPTAASGIAARL